MSVSSELTAIANKIRALLGLTGTMGLSDMNTNLGAEQTNIANAYEAISNMGGTVPSSQISGGLATAINSIPKGATVQVKTGTVTGVSGSAKTVKCGFKADAVFFTGSNPYGESIYHGGVALTAKNVTSAKMLFAAPSTSYIYSIFEVKQTSEGFSVAGVRISTSGSQSNESNRSLDYIAIKYTE